MSKNKKLTRQEIDELVINNNIIEIINTIKNDNIRILDFGCGRGAAVIKFKLDGLDAYGVDVDEVPLENGKSIIKELGFSNPDNILFKISSDCRTSFPNEHFDLVFSNQVIEHVENIDAFFKEIYRITKPGGVNFHLLPNYRFFIEPHLYMPFIHWLPKNNFRFWTVYFFTLIGIEPRWPELSQLNQFDKAKVYYIYSINKTYYRPNKIYRTILHRFNYNIKISRDRKSKLSLMNPRSYFKRQLSIHASKQLYNL